MSVEVSPISSCAVAPGAPGTLSARTIAIGSGLGGNDIEAKSFDKLEAFFTVFFGDAREQDFLLVLRTQQATECPVDFCIFDGHRDILIGWYFMVALSSASEAIGTSITVVNVLLDGKPMSTFLLFCSVRPQSW